MMSTFKNRVLVCLATGMLLSMPFTTAVSAQDAKSESSDVAVPAGGALSEAEIIILLQAKVPLALIQKFVTVRGVNFVSTKETSKRIITAGGDVSLIGTVNLNQKDESVVAMTTPVGGNGKKKNAK
jgi:hypothetical protein